MNQLGGIGRKKKVDAASDLIVRDEDPHEQDGTQADPNSDEETEMAIRGTKPLFDIYERCNATLLEPINYIEAAVSAHWRIAMKEELHMIERTILGNWWKD